MVLLRSQLRLGQIYFDADKPDVGQTKFDAMIKRLSPEDGYHIPHLLLYIASCNFNAQRYEVSESVYLRTKALAESTKSEDYDSVIVDILNSLSNLYYTTKAVDESERYYTKFISAMEHGDLEPPTTNSKFLRTNKALFYNSSNLRISLQMTLKKLPELTKNSLLKTTFHHPVTDEAIEVETPASSIITSANYMKDGHEFKISSPCLDLSLEKAENLKTRRFLTVTHLILDSSKTPHSVDSIHKQWVDIRKFSELDSGNEE